MYLISVVEKYWLKLVFFYYCVFILLLVSFKFLIILWSEKVRFRIFVLLAKEYWSRDFEGKDNEFSFKYVESEVQSQGDL